MNRRDLLSRQAARAASQVLGLLDDGPLLEETASSELPPLVRVARRAMATSFEVLIPFGTPDALRAAETVLDEIDRIEDLLTVYRQSQVWWINQLSSEACLNIRVPDDLFALLQHCQRIHQETEGAFDVALGSLIKAWGFFRGPRRVPPHSERLTALRKSGMRNVLLYPNFKTVFFRQVGLELNFGSIGKGYALDEAARVMRQRHDIGSALLHGGHSSVLAVGTQLDRRRGWEIGLTDPWRPERRLAVVHLRDRALGTSAATFQHLEYNGRKLGHILDPRTGWPAEELASVSVTAPTAAEADALATAFFILGLDKTRAYCAGHPEVGAVVLPNDAATPVLLGRALSEVDLVPSNAEPVRVTP